MLALYWQMLRMKYMLNVNTGKGYTKVTHGFLEGSDEPTPPGYGVRSSLARGGNSIS